jgi:transcriptional regulator with XRE-family HTH domain
MDGNRLGEFLRARRKVTPFDQTGLPNIRRGRRTPGLRRDEVAALAGVSIDYYVKLEQGRERNPSAQVLAALARVFRLDPEATEHLYRLARPRAHKRIEGAGDQVSPHVLLVMESLHHLVAFVVNHRLDVLAQNQEAAALHEGLEYSDNLMRMTFLGSTAREFYVNWELEAWYKVAHLRAAAGSDYADPGLCELVEELSRASEDFRRLWARHDVRARAHEPKHLHHRVVGDLDLWQETFAVNSAPGQCLFVCLAEPGSPSEQAMVRLGCLAAGRG